MGAALSGNFGGQKKVSAPPPLPFQSRENSLPLPPQFTSKEKKRPIPIPFDKKVSGKISFCPPPISNQGKLSTPSIYFEGNKLPIPHAFR